MDEQQTSSQTNLLGTVVLLLTFILPYHLVPMFVWARNLWLDWRTGFSSNHNVLRVIPLLGVVELAGLARNIRTIKV